MYHGTSCRHLPWWDWFQGCKGPFWRIWTESSSLCWSMASMRCDVAPTTVDFHLVMRGKRGINWWHHINLYSPRRWSFLLIICILDVVIAYIIGELMLILPYTIFRNGSAFMCIQYIYGSRYAYLFFAPSYKGTTWCLYRLRYFYPQSHKEDTTVVVFVWYTNHSTTSSTYSST